MSNIITSVEDAVIALRPRLTDYLSIHLGIKSTKKAFLCPFHDDKGRPNMYLNPKSGFETATCFSCNKTADIFNFASKLEGLPNHGPEWVSITIPKIAEQLDIKIQLGEVSETSKMKSLLMKLAQNISDILIHYEDEYAEERGWNNTKLLMGSIDSEELINKLIENGWSKHFILESKLVEWDKRTLDDQIKTQRLFGKDKFTFVIQDSYRRPIGFTARWKEFNKEIHEEKYFHNLNNLIFNKSKVLFGLSCDVEKCKQHGIYLVEGPGDVAALHTKGIFNCAAVLGTAVTEEHILELKKLGIKKVILTLDWDEAGQKAEERIVENVFSRIKDISYFIKSIPETKEKDIDDYLKIHSAEEFLKIKEFTLFEYKLKKLDPNLEDEEKCKLMIPLIATEQSAIKRNVLTKQLAEYTNIDYAAIETDIESFRTLDVKDRHNSIMAVGQEFLLALQADPDNAISLLSQVEQGIEKVEKRYNNSVVGVNYQLQRYQALQELRNLSNEDHDSSIFKMKFFTELMEVLSGGMPITRGCQIYAGGRANSGKTLSCLAIGSDVALHDENAMTLIQTMDDSYEQIEPRLKTNIYNMHYRDEFNLTLDMVVSPWRYKSDEVRAALKKADELFMDLLSEEKLVILDANDGSNLTTFEKNLRYYRNRYPDRKVLCIQDNTHDLQDFGDLDQVSRMKMISTGQKRLTNKYNMCLLATVEYRKAQPGYNTKMIIPTNDDIADSRAMSYKPNLIFHVYNDLADRQESAEVFYINKDGKKCPRLLWVFTKNKINSFKGRLVNDVDPGSVMIWPKNVNEVANEWDKANKLNLPEENLKEMKELEDDLGYEVETDYVEEVEEYAS